MSTIANSFEATNSFIGYYYQAMYSLILLLDADDYAEVSIETEDDIVLKGQDISLHQIKHSLSDPPPLSHKSDSFWKTIRIWSSIIEKTKYKFLLITCAPILAGDILSFFANHDGDVDTVLGKLEVEANRVVKEVEYAKSLGITPPFKIKYPGCNAFLKLSRPIRKHLIENIQINDSNFTALDLNSEISSRIKNSTPPNHRNDLVVRLMEWWDSLVVRSLLRQRSRQINKVELQTKISELIQEFADDNLPDDFSDKEPSNINAEIGNMMAKQIEIVDGGEARIQRAAIARWQARNQRNKWLDYDISLSDTLDRYDKTLVRTWKNHHAPIKDDCKNKSDEEMKAEGIKLLDWSHHIAALEITPPRRSWTQPFYTQGMYQQLSEELKVGWHPYFYDILGNI